LDILYDTTLNAAVVDDGALLFELARVGATVELPSLLQNVGIATSVGSSAMTVALKQKDGSTDPAGGTGAVGIGLRDSTLSTGGFNIRSVVAALSLVIPSGATLGTTDGDARKIYVYGIDNVGTVELAVSRIQFPENELVSTTILNSSSDDPGTIFSTTARSNIPIKLLGHFVSTQATAGTWNTNATEIYVGDNQDKEKIIAIYQTNAGQLITVGTTEVVDYEDIVQDTHGTVTVGATWNFKAPRTDSYLVAGIVSYNAYTAARMMETKIRRNGGIVAGGMRYSPAVNDVHGVVYSATIDAIKDQTIDVTILNDDVSDRSLVVTSIRNRISITSLG